MKDGFLEVDKDRVKIKVCCTATRIRDIEALEAQILKRTPSPWLYPPGIKDFAVEVRQSEGRLRDVLERLISEGKAVKVKGDLYFHSDVIEDLKKKVRSYLSEKKEMTPSEFKSVLDLSRKYMIPLLEYLDEIKVTIRTGDKRILRSS